MKHADLADGTRMAFVDLKFFPISGSESQKIKNVAPSTRPGIQKMNSQPDTEKVFFNGYCPGCGVGKARIVRTDRPIQYAKCDRCGVRWQIVSVNLFLESALDQAAELDRQARLIRDQAGFLLKSR